MTQDTVGTINDTLVDQSISLAKKAGAVIMRTNRPNHKSIIYKRDGSPVTPADRMSNEVIVTGLRLMTPEIPILTEEAGSVPFAVRKSWRRWWLVDPLDGTREFLRGADEFTVNIALMNGFAPILGVVFAPATGALYFATRWSRTEKNNHETPSARQSNIPSQTPCIVLVSHREGERRDDFRRIFGCTENPNYTIVRMGSSLKLCLLAEGKAELYLRLGPTMEWDTAAGQCILEAAGGCIMDASGQALAYNKSSLTNPGFLAKAAQVPNWASRLYS